MYLFEYIYACVGLYLDNYTVKTQFYTVFSENDVLKLKTDVFFFINHLFSSSKNNLCSLCFFYSTLFFRNRVINR